MRHRKGRSANRCDPCPAPCTFQTVLPGMRLYTAALARPTVLTGPSATCSANGTGSPAQIMARHRCGDAGSFFCPSRSRPRTTPAVSAPGRTHQRHTSCPTHISDPTGWDSKNKRSIGMIRNTPLATVPFVFRGLVHTVRADMPPRFAGPGVETQTGQAVYQLPRDHASHGGARTQAETGTRKI